jgi:uncharacterized Zn-finger protein
MLQPNGLSLECALKWVLYCVAVANVLGQNLHLECSVCGKLLSSRKSLQIHMRIHEDIVPFICETCGKSFRQQSNLKSHVINIHTDEAKFQCEKCPRKLFPIFSLSRFISLCQIIRIIRMAYMHFKIFLVLKSKFTRLTFKLNFIITDFEVYECNIWDKKFTRADTYKNHMHVHEEPKFTCSYCQRRYHSKTGLLKHFKICNDEVKLECRMQFAMVKKPLFSVKDYFTYSTDVFPIFSLSRFVSLCQIIRIIRMGWIERAFKNSQHWW